MRLSRKTLPLLMLLSILALALSAQSAKFSISPSQVKPGDKGVLKATLVIPDGWKQTYDPGTGQNEYFFVNIAEPAPKGLSFGPVQYPKSNETDELGAYIFHGSVTLTRSFTVKADAKPGKLNLPLELTYGLCNDQGCQPPDILEGKASLEILPADAAAGDAEATPEEPADTLSATPATAQAETSGTPESAPADTPRSVWNIIYYMLLAVLGGIVLNFTPCVLPILPIRAMSMVNQAQKDVTKVLLHSLVYTLGVLISFGIIAAIIVIARVSGVNLTYGFLNQYLGYHLFMLSMLFLFGLSLMGVFELTIPGMNAASGLTARKGYAGSFFGGIFAFLMGFACMGPFMGPALEVAVRLSSPLLILFFLLIGFGFALPFVIISLFPKALKYIPKPGEWMNIFKEVMGFLLMLLVWKYLSNIWGVTKSGSYLLQVAHYIVFLGFGAWLYGRFVRVEKPKWMQFLFSLVAVGVIAWSAWNYLPFKDKEPEQELSAEQLSGLRPAEYPGWYVFSEATLDSLLAQGKPVFVDIGATWCSNCKTNMKKVLSQDDIKAAFADKGVTLLYGDFSNQDPALNKWIEGKGGAGVPFNLLFIPGRDPIKMAPLFSKKDIFDALALIPAPEGK